MDPPILVLSVPTDFQIIDFSKVEQNLLPLACQDR